MDKTHNFGAQFIDLSSEDCHSGSGTFKVGERAIKLSPAMRLSREARLGCKDDILNTESRFSE